MGYIEPCCCERQLPRLLKEQGMAFFQTSGDVTVRHLMKSVGCMVKNGCTMWLMAASVDVELLRVIRHWQERGWVAQVRLMTREDCEAVVAGELAVGAAIISQHTGQEAASEAVGEPQRTGQEATSEAAVMYGKDERLTGGLLAFDDGKEAVVIQGEMLLGTVPGMKGYAGCFGAVGSDAVKGAMDAVKALMKARAKAVTSPCGETQGTAAVAGEMVIPAGKPQDTVVEKQGTAAEKQGAAAGAARASPETKEETEMGADGAAAEPLPAEKAARKRTRRKEEGSVE